MDRCSIARSACVDPRGGRKLPREIQEVKEISSFQSGECDRSLIYRQEQRKVRGHVGGEGHELKRRRIKRRKAKKKERKGKKRQAEGAEIPARLRARAGWDAPSSHRVR